jgi:hypothetical protein
MPDRRSEKVHRIATSASSGRSNGLDSLKDSHRFRQSVSAINERPGPPTPKLMCARAQELLSSLAFLLLTTLQHSNYSSR